MTGYGLPVGAAARSVACARMLHRSSTWWRALGGGTPRPRSPRRGPPRPRGRRRAPSSRWSHQDPVAALSAARHGALPRHAAPAHPTATTASRRPLPRLITRSALDPMLAGGAPSGATGEHDGPVAVTCDAAEARHRRGRPDRRRRAGVARSARPGPCAWRCRAGAPPATGSTRSSLVAGAGATDAARVVAAWPSARAGSRGRCASTSSYGAGPGRAAPRARRAPGPHALAPPPRGAAVADRRLPHPRPIAAEAGPRDDRVARRRSARRSPARCTARSWRPRATSTSRRWPPRASRGQVADQLSLASSCCARSPGATSTRRSCVSGHPSPRRCAALAAAARQRRRARASPRSRGALDDADLGGALPRRRGAGR